jgi:hypothetical protein
MDTRWVRVVGRERRRGRRSELDGLDGIHRPPTHLGSAARHEPDAGSGDTPAGHVRDTDGVEPLRGRGPRVALSSRLVRGVASKSSLGRSVSCGACPVVLIAISGRPRMPRMREVAWPVEVGAGCST